MNTSARLTRRLAPTSLVITVLLWASGPARAEEGDLAGAGEFLRGAATVIDAVGNLYNQQEQARIVREQANQAKLETRRKRLDLINYERENAWTYTQEKERWESFKIRRLLNKPVPAEIVNGSALNTLLPYMLRLTVHSVQGEPVFLNQDHLKLINVTGMASGSSLGPLGKGKIFWPLGLRGATQKQVDAAIAQGVEAARDGTLEPDLFREMSAGLDKLQKEASARWLREEIDAGMYLEAKRFLESVRSGLTVLRQPDAAKYLSGAYQPQGKTIAELVQSMCEQGLRFAPATAGSEPAYFALHSAMVAYAAGGPDESSFRIRLGPYTGTPAMDRDAPAAAAEDE